MISLILGHKGSGKTKRLIGCVNEAIEQSKGNVICVEEKTKLTYDVDHRARLISASDYRVSGFNAFYGFLAGICAGDHDITDVLVDATLKIGGRDYEALANFLENVAELSKIAEQDITFTISCDESDLPARIFDFCEKI